MKSLKDMMGDAASQSDAELAAKGLSQQDIDVIKGVRKAFNLTLDDAEDVCWAIEKSTMPTVNQELTVQKQIKDFMDKSSGPLKLTLGASFNSFRQPWPTQHPYSPRAYAITSMALLGSYTPLPQMRKEAPRLKDLQFKIPKGAASAMTALGQACKAAGAAVNAYAKHMEKQLAEQTRKKLMDEAKTAGIPPANEIPDITWAPLLNSLDEMNKVTVPYFVDGEFVGFPLEEREL